ncbi:LuxR C-terminal-related transcriptional regulator [Catenulispora yoronensis]|uniref:LuxR C-terminal-related transcriptional regulator n=1 Tax=Catenulispora yoronensis TaxID=450799 RepID=UPI0031D73C33
MNAQPAARTADISDREAEVLAGVGEHLTNAEIAGRLYISVRTVESHISSMLRKFGVNDRRALVRLAAADRRPAAGLEVRKPGGTLPAPLTPFVGRTAEVRALLATLAEHRLVTAVGPGGIGKTRLALATAGQTEGRFGDLWYVDLVPISDDAMVAPAVTDALGLGEQQGRSPQEAALAWLADREGLLLLDNCEHLADGVVMLVERILTVCPRVRVLATSRARLLVPHEQVFPVPGMAIDDSGADGDGDAVDLFEARALAAGTTLGLGDRRRVAAICRALDGVALAIELAAARLPALGLDGLQAALADRLDLLTGGRRLDDRHRSLRSALDWSHALLSTPEQAVLRRVSVFAAPFTAEAAAALLSDWPPAGSVPTVLAGLADHSLLTTVPAADGTRYRMLETIRQYGAERLLRADEHFEAGIRHLRWCLAQAEEWSDRILEEIPSALDWAATEPEARAEGHRLALVMAELCFLHGRPGEAQRRYEQAAVLAADDTAAADALAKAATAAEIRHFGGEAIRLHRACADAARRTGARASAAYHLAQAAELIKRGPGLVQGTDLPDPAALLAEAALLADGDPSALARIAVVEAYLYSDLDPHDLGPAERAVALSRQAGDPLAESAGLDQLTSVQLARGEIRAAADSALRRAELVAPYRQRPLDAGMELFDAYQMAAECATAAGDLAGARRLAEQVHDLPFYQEEGHLATSRLLVVTALTGDWDDHAVFAERFRQGWEHAGRPRAGNLSRAPYAAAAVCGLRGDDAGRQWWLSVVEAIATPGLPIARIRHGAFFDALVLLHHGRADEALALLTTPPEDLRAWYSGMWRTWYAAVWAESAVLAGDASAEDRLRRARPETADNPVAAAIVERCVALAAGDRKTMLAAADRLLVAGCRYQWARTLVLADGPEREQGVEALAAIGAAPMK